MTSSQPNTHSFIIKIWLEGADATTGRLVWRGRITHVPSGDVYHFVQIHDIADFMLPYLQQLGVPPPRWWRLRRWWSQWWA